MMVHAEELFLKSMRDLDFQNFELYKRVYVFECFEMIQENTSLDPQGSSPPKRAT